MSDKTLTPDLCVIGGNLGGRALAASAAAAGVPVVMFPGAKGEDAARSAAALTLPAMAAVARRVRAIRTAGRLGIEIAERELSFAEVRKRVEGVAADLGRNWSDARLAALGVHVIHAAPRFIDPRAVAADDGVEIRARRFVLAQPSTPKLPHIDGLSRAPHLTVDRLLELRDRPEQLIVLGAGATGLACAQAFRRLGAAVAMLDTAMPLAGEDHECAAILLGALAREGIDVRGAASVTSIETGNGIVRISFSASGKEEAIEGDQLLLATGRRTEVNALGLEMAGIEHDDGAIRTGADFRTTNARVLSIRDRPMNVHVMQAEAQAILRNLLLRLPSRHAAMPLPRATHTDPPLAHVGLTEAEARERHGQVHVLRAPFAENERAVIEREAAGAIKIVTTATGKLLGVSIVGGGAPELIGVYALAIAKGMKISGLAGLHFPHPTRAEIGRAAVLPALVRDLTRRWVRRIIALLRQFG